MNVIDSSGWLEYLADEKNADFFAPAIIDYTNVIVPVICIYEVYKVTLRERDQSFALEAIGVMQEGEVINIDQSISLKAATISHEKKLPMADSMIYATAQINEAVVWTQDADFKNLPGVKYIEKSS